MKQKILQMMFAAFVCAGARAQVNSGSNGSDGAFNPATSIVINMASHPNGIYQYTSVNISNGVNVTFIPNANNSPVTWLVQGNCEIDGTVNLSGQGQINGSGGVGGPGGFSGGNGGTFGTSGQGPGAGLLNAGNASYATSGGSGSTSGAIYGNQFILPLIGGSGGAGNTNVTTVNGVGSGGGSGGGGAILIAASGQIQLNGSIYSFGGGGSYGGWGSGGSVRLVASQLTGSGVIYVYGSGGADGYGYGRIRLDAIDNRFGGLLYGIASQGFQPVIIPAAGQGVQLSIASVGGIAVPADPSGVIATPDAIISGQQANPISIVVNCSNLPLNTPITVTMRPASGSSVSAVGYNTTGTQASSTATLSLTMPHGGGNIYATAATSN